VRAVGGQKLPRMIEKWCVQKPGRAPNTLRRSGKPVLMAAAGGFGRRQGLATFDKGPGHVELGVNVGESFSYMGRGAVYIMIGKLATLECDVCFTVEGRADEELPEVVLGAATFTALKLADKFRSMGEGG